MIIPLLKKVVPSCIKKKIKKYSKEEKLFLLLNPVMPSCLCIDIGASYYPHSNWRLFLQSKNTYWIAVDPNAANLDYINKWSYSATVIPVYKGLSKDGGKKKLYVTNIDSGSSLHKPTITSSMRHRINHVAYQYFFPLQEKEIETITLGQVVAESGVNHPMLIKLDTQGSELSIIKGIEYHLNSKNVIGIEMESTLLAEPIMKDSAKFWESQKYLESFGFELIGLKPISALSSFGVKKPRGNLYINECDSIYALRRDLADQLPVQHRVTLFIYYLSNRFYEEAMSLFMDDIAIKEYFIGRQVSAIDIEKLLLRLVRG